MVEAFGSTSCAKKTLHNFAAHKILYCGGRTSGRGNLLRYDGGAGAPPRPKTDGDVHLILRCLTTARARPIPHKDNRYLSVDPRVFLSQRCYTGACITIIILRIKICSRRNSRTMRTDSSTTVCQDQVWMHGLAHSHDCPQSCFALKLHALSDRIQAYIVSNCSPSRGRREDVCRRHIVTPYSPQSSCVVFGTLQPIRRVGFVHSRRVYQEPRLL